MALLNPTFDTIGRLRVSATEGELHLLKFLSSALDDKYEIFFQPFINGDNPDIIIMRKNSGVLIIEVKDWHLINYFLDKKKHWRLKENGAYLKSPLSQVLSYKENLYTLHIEHLLEKKIRNQKLFSVVTCAVYFHNETENSIKSFLLEKFSNDERYKKFISYFELIGRDTLKKEKFQNILHKRWLDRYSKFFDNNLYQSFKKYLSPPIHTIEQGIEIQYTKKQSELIDSKPIQQKIKGVPGSGKTMILAKRAVNAHKRTKTRILILTYNITLKNYIHDKISEVKEEFNCQNFYITNYHNFITTQLNNLGIPIRMPENLNEVELSEYLEQNYYSNEKIFESFKDSIDKYHSIFIDEIQDYKTEWLKIIKRYFLIPNGELVVYGDEKQNIYERQLDSDRKPNTGIPGRWNELNESFRLTTKIANLAIKYQNYFFAKKYDIDIIQIIKQQSIFDVQELIEYYFFKSTLTQNIIFEKVINIIKELNTHPNDICFLSPRVEILRELDYFIRSRIKQKTNTTFETKEMWEKLKSEIDEEEKFKREIERIRHNKKFNFWMNSGTIKLSTIHSFKGWEIHTLFLIIDSGNELDEFLSDELVYAGITRCRFNLYILNIGNIKYHDFFTSSVKNTHFYDRTFPKIV